MIIYNQIIKKYYVGNKLYYIKVYRVHNEQKKTNTKVYYKKITNGNIFNLNSNAL